ncbi:MAG: DUF4212 domain-containing protein [Burkholderiales bacterium]
MKLTQKHKDYWRKNLRVTGSLLAIWIVVSFVLTYFADALTFDFIGWPFSFYMSAQGSLIIYMLIIWLYARYMNRLDEQYGVNELDDES